MKQSTGQQYLSFSLAGERYAVGIDRVHEVLEYTHITPLPRMDNFMKGIINLRGTGIPVIDLRLRFGMPETQIGKDTAIIVIELGDAGPDAGDNAVVGALADAVHEVIELPASSLEPPPSFGTGLDLGLIQGVGKYDGGFMIVLDIDRVMQVGPILNSASSGEAEISEASPAEAVG